MKRQACEQCYGTDTQRECEQGQCYAEECQRQEEEHALEQREWERRNEGDAAAQLWNSLAVYQSADGTWIQVGKNDFVAAVAVSQEPLRRALEHGPDCGTYNLACRQCLDDFARWKAALNTGDGQ